MAVILISSLADEGRSTQPKRPKFAKRSWKIREYKILRKKINGIKTTHIPDQGNSAVQPDSSHIATVHLKQCSIIVLP